MERNRKRTLPPASVELSMFGYLTAVLLLAAGGYVLWYNAHHIDSVVLLPFLTTFVPSLEGDLPAQGRVSAIVLFALGGLALLWRLGRDIRAARRRDTP